MTSTAVPPRADAEVAGALAGRLFGSVQESLEVMTVHIGDRLGLYRALADAGPLTFAELAAAASIHERYAREWLEQQAMSELLEVDDPSAPAGDRRYALPRGHAEALLDRTSPSSIAPLANGAVACAAALPSVLEAFRTGGGVPWSAYGPDAIEAQGDFNRPWLLADLAHAHLPLIPDVHARLSAPAARVADLACGVGWASVAIARGYPGATVHGVDADPDSIARARRNAEAAGVADRVRFSVADISDTGLEGRYDLVLSVEGVHDLPRPVEALATMRRIMAPGGAAVVVEEKVGDAFSPGHPVERFMYGFSVLLCLPAGMAEQPSAATGTVMRPDVLRRYAVAAGFRDVEILDIDRPMQRYYRLWP